MDLFTADSLWLLSFFFTTCIVVQALHSIFKKAPAGKLPPGPFPFPVIGNLLELGDKPHQSLAKLAKTHGPLMSLKLGQVTTVVISSSTMARELFQNHDHPFSSRTIPDSVRAHGHHQVGLPWVPVATLWRNLRKICNSHLFTPQKLNASQDLRYKKVQHLLDGVRESCHAGAAVEIGQAAFNTSLNFLSNTLFSVDLADDPNSDTAREFKKVVSDIMEDAGKPNLADYFPVLKKLDPQGVRSRMEVSFGRILEIFARMIDDRLLSRRAHNYSPSNDLLDTLLNINQENSDELSMSSVKHLLLDLFGAGTDTTSNTMEWAMAELLHKPETLVKAKAELEQSIGRGNPVKESDIASLPYLQAVVKETMRLHPAVPLLLPRKAEENVEIGGFTVPKGAQVLVNAWAIGRDPSVWENPESFVPERFLESDIDFKGKYYELIPFGSGRRICPGLPLAIRMMHLMLGSVIHHFDWKLENGVSAEEINMEEKFGLTLGMAQPLRAVPVPVPT